MTATVTEDAELGFLLPQTLESLMQNDPDLCSGATDVADPPAGDSASAKGAAPQGEAACVGGTPCVFEASSVWLLVSYKGEKNWLCNRCIARITGINEHEVADI